MRFFLSLTFLWIIIASPAHPASKQEIDIKVEGTLERFRSEVTGGRQFLERAAGALVFPSIKKGAFFVGGSYGEGALLEAGRTTGYYSAAAGSFGFQFGGQSSSRILLFMTDEALAAFKQQKGWEVGVDADVTLVELGAGTAITTKTTDAPIVAFVFGQKGLLAGIDLSGTKISPISR